MIFSQEWFNRKTPAIGLVQILLLAIVLSGQAFSQLEIPESKPSIILTQEEQECSAVLLLYACHFHTSQPTNPLYLFFYKSKPFS